MLDRRDSRSWPTIRLTSSATATNSARLAISCGSATAKERLGARANQATPSALANVAATPGHRPPNRAETITASMNGKYGAWSPSNGKSTNRTPSAANTASTAKPYLQVEETGDRTDRSDCS